MNAAAWRAAGDPRGAHALCQALSTQQRYEHSRGVAQQAARAARCVRLPGDRRRVLLAAAWLHDIGYALHDGPHAVAGARALRRAGHERLARIVAHHSNASEKAMRSGRQPIEPEFPRPAGGDAHLLTLLDIADLLTGPWGERVDPAGRLAGVVERHGPDSVSVQALVGHVNRLGADPVTRAIVEDLSAQAVPS